MKKSLFVYCFICFSSFSQNTYKTYFFNEVFIAPNKTIVFNQDENTGRLGFDLGLKRVCQIDSLINFVYGLELDYIKFYYEKVENYSIFAKPEVGDYKKINTSSLILSNTFNCRFNLSKSKRMYIETGFDINYRLRQHYRGFYLENKGPYVEHNLNEMLPINKNNKHHQKSLAFNFGLAYNINFNKFEMAIKPEMKVVLLPYLTNFLYDRFGNFAYTRLVFCFKLLDK